MKTRALALLSIAAILTAGTIAISRVQSRHAGSEAIASRQKATAEQSTRRDADIAFFENRITTDSLGAIDRAKLAGLYLQRARERNNFSEILAAESLSRASLAIRTARNDAAFAVLTSSLLSQHRFTEARDAAQQLVNQSPETDSYRAILGETCLELGDYVGAKEAFAAISAAGRSSLSVAPRLARWAEIRGDTASARRLMRAAASTSSKLPGITIEQAAWFQLRLADVELHQGRLQHAERALQAGLVINPVDARLLSAMSRVASIRHDFKSAVAYGDSSMAIALDPATVGQVSDAYAALNDSVNAAEYMATMEVAVGQQPGAYHRAWSLFLLDHGARIPEVLLSAQQELRTRKDIYGYDLLAWAQFRSGRNAEARRNIDIALSQGTQDAMLFYHAGMIHHALGDFVSSRGLLQRALAISPAFDAAAPAVARATLESMSARTVATGR